MIVAVIVAGGIGSRMKSSVKKQYLVLDDLPIVAHTLMAFDRYDALDHIILVVPESDLHYCRSGIVEPLHLDHEIHIVAGGSRRQVSVLNGLKAIDASEGIVMIHDGVRPFVRPSLMGACIAGVRSTGACIPVISATDTLKRVDENGLILMTVDRQQIRLAQTPQTFTIGLIRRAHHLAAQREFIATDDASVAEFSGEKVAVVPGDRDNIKITTPQDLLVARAIHGSWTEKNTNCRK